MSSHVKLSVNNAQKLIAIIAIFPCLIFAESELAAIGNTLPLPYKPTDSIQLLIKTNNKTLLAIYPNATKQQLLSDFDKPLSYPQIIADLNFDGFKDLAIHTKNDPRGLNSVYTFFLWNNDKKLLTKSGEFVNPNIEDGFIVENSLDTSFSCKPICLHKTRYRWVNNTYRLHSYISEIVNSKNIKIAFVKDEKVTKTLIVASDQIQSATEKWDTENHD